MTGRARRRIGYLTYGLDRPLSGVTRVAQELGRALAERGELEITYLTPYRRGPFRDGRHRAQYLPGCALLPALMVLGGPLITAIARRLRLDLVHDPVGISPFTVGRSLGRYRRVVTIHDAIAFRYPEGYPWLNNFLHRRFIPATLPWVDAVVTVSQHAASDLKQYLRVPSSRLFVVPNGVSPAFQPLPAACVESVTARHGLDRPYVLSVAAHQARKNVAGVLEAFAQVRACHPDLLLALAGPTLWPFPEHRERIVRLGLTEAVRQLGYVPDEDLPALYGGASAFAFPSLYEGFGLPVLEAMACGTPVVCSNASSLPEVAGDAAIAVDPTDNSGLASALASVVDDPALAGRLRERGLARAAAFSWTAAAQQLSHVYDEVMAR